MKVSMSQFLYFVILISADSSGGGKASLTFQRCSIAHPLKAESRQVHLYADIFSSRCSRSSSSAKLSTYLFLPKLRRDDRSMTASGALPSSRPLSSSQSSSLHR